MNELFVIMYHYVRKVKDGRYPGMKALEYDDFERQISFFEREFNIVTMEDILDALDGRKVLPEKAVLLTFDDAYIDCWNNVFPLLDEKNIQGSFFISGEAVIERKLMDVNSIQFILSQGDIDEIKEDLDRLLDEYRKDNEEAKNLPSNQDLFAEFGKASRFDNEKTIYVKRLLQRELPYAIRHSIVHRLFSYYSDVDACILGDELYMTKQQLTHMKRSSMHIGLHGYEHIWGGCLSDKDMREWIDRSLSALGEYIDINNWTMSYPFGSYSDEMISYISSKGCKAGFLSQVGKAEINERYRYRIVRFDANDFPPKSNNYLTL